MSFFDKIESGIQRVAPGWGRRRAFDRTATTINEIARKKAIEFSYDAAKTNRNQTGWGLDGESPDSDINDALGGMRGRSRDLQQNSGKANGIILAYINGIIGTGIKPEPRLDEKVLGISPERARDLEDELKEGFRIWSEHSDASGRLNFFQQQRQNIWGLVVNGEGLYLPVTVEGTASPLTLRLQAIESDRLQTPNDKISDANIHAGVVVDPKFGAPTAYYIQNFHPGENRSVVDDLDGFSRVPAMDKFGRKLVFHTFTQDRAGQTRGVPILAPVLTTLYDQEQYMKAERIAKLLSACFGLIINQNDGTNATGPLTTSDGKVVEEFVPGMVMHSTNATIEQVKPDRPGDSFLPYMQENDRDIANGCGLSRELAMRDITNANFSSLRWAMSDARRLWSIYQQLDKQSFSQPTWEHFVDEMVLSRLINMPKYFENRPHWLNVEWVPDSPGFVDIESEVKATKLALEAGTTTLQQISLAQSGVDFRALIKQQGIEKRLKEEEGLIPTAEELAAAEKPASEEENNET